MNKQLNAEIKRKNMN